MDRALLFTDLVDSTLLVERLGDARAAELWTLHDRQARDLLASHHGREIDRSDGFFLLFDDVADAAGYALAYQRAMAELALSARIGLHLGPVSLRENAASDVARGAKRVEVEGLAKPFAARIMGLARGGQTLLSAPARGALGDALGEELTADSEIQSHGHYRLKGIEAPAEVFELGRRGSATFAPPHDTDKAYRVVRNGELWRPVREVRHNLAPERDAFVGRAAELRAFALRLDDGARLVTLLGPGGTGKTRLVRRYAMAWLGDWPGGVCFCDLSEARSLDGVLFAVALALGVPLGKGDPVLQLGHAMASRGRCLVILDNFEQVVEHASATLGRWLDRAAEATFAVTSRERLHLPGEEVFAVDPLPLESDAVDLFAARARAQVAGFTLNDANRAAVAEVARLLDGLPLAIELAAARVRVLSPAQIVERLTDRFRLLAGARGTAARQATLKAAIDWSWDLLAPWEQAALAQCSVFEGGFTLEAAEAVLDLAPWPDAPPAMDAVQALVDKSLLRTWSAFAPGRYDLDEPYFGMYLSIHEYAAEKLNTSGHGVTRAAQQLHAHYFARFGTDAALETLHRRGGVARLRALALELDNLVAACRRAVAHGDGAAAAATCRAAWEVLDRQGPFALGVALGTQVLGVDAIDAASRSATCVILGLASRRIGHASDAESWLLQALAHAREAGDRRAEGVALGQMGLLHNALGRIDEAQANAEAALAIQRALGHRRLEGAALGNLGNLHLGQGRMDEALAHFEAALAIQRELGNRRAEGGLLGGLAILHHDQGRMEEARPYYEASLAIQREVADRLAEGIVLSNLGTLHNDQGRLDQARAVYEAALAMHREIGDRLGEGVTLGNLGKLSADQGLTDEARVHYEAALAIVRETGNRRDEGVMLGHLGALHGNCGRADEAQVYLEAALAVHREVGNRRFEGEVLGNLGELLARQGQLSEARAALAEGEALLRELDDRLDLAKLLCLRGQVDMASGEPARARAALEEAEALAVALRAEAGSELGRVLGELRAALA